MPIKKTAALTIAQIPYLSSFSAHKRALMSQAKGAFYELALLFSKHFEKLSSNRLALLTDYHLTRAKKAKASKTVFKKHLIHFGINFEHPKTLALLPKQAKLERLARRTIAASPPFFKATKMLLFKNKKHKGLCMAASAHCAQKFYKFLQMGYPERAAFAKATAEYEEGMPEKDAIVQSLITLREINKNEMTNLEIISNYDTRFTSKDNYLKLINDDAQLTNFFKLEMSEHTISFPDKMAKDFKEQPVGVYLVSLVTRNDYSAGHMVMIRKNGDRSLSVYDPAFGAGIIPENKVGSFFKRFIQNYKPFQHVAYVPVNKR